MKKIVMDSEYDFHPEVIEENFADPELLDYIVANHPSIDKIEIEDVKEITPDKKLYAMKYTINVPIPGFLQKMVKSDSNTMGISMEMDRKTLTAKIDVKPDIMPDKVSSSGKAVFTQKGDKWVQHVEVDLEVKVKMIGGQIEKFAVKMAGDILSKEFELRNEFLKKKLG